MGSKLKIKLIRPPVMMSFPANTRMPYGMGIITATLRRNGYEVDQDDLFAKAKHFNSNLRLFSNRVINLGIFSFDGTKVMSCLRDGVSDPLLNRLAENLLNLTSYKDSSIVGFSLHSYSEFLFSLLLAQKIKQGMNVPIVFGGPFVTLHAEFYFKKYKFIDYMIVGDGRIPLLKLLNFLEGNCRIEDVPNLYYRKNGVVKVNLRQYFDIENIPLPDFDGLPLELYKQDCFEGTLFLPYQISRGCLGNCSYCSFRKVDETPSIKSADKVIGELREYSSRYGSKYFSMCDTTLNTFYKETEKICELLILSKLGIQWEAFVRISNLDENLLYKMKQAGCSLVKLGIESGSDRIIQLMRKGFTAEQASRVLRICHSLGINTRVYLIIGYPHETQEDVDRTIAFIKENKNYIQSFSLYRFRIDCGSFISVSPEEFGVENLRYRSNIFIFDEIGGLRYKAKEKRITKAMNQILNVIYKDILFKKYKIGLLPFYLFLWSEKISNSWIKLLLRSLPQRILNAIYSLEPRYFGGSIGGKYGIYITKHLFPFQRIRRKGPRQPTIFKDWSQKDD